MKKKCVVCKEEIDPKTKHVLLGTYEDKNVLDESFFHFDCFRRWHNQKVTEKSMNTINKITGDLLSNIKKIKK